MGEVLDDLVARGLKRPELVIMEGGKAALAGMWNEVPVQRCTVQKERNLVAHAPKRMAEGIKKVNEMSTLTRRRRSLPSGRPFLAK